MSTARSAAEPAGGNVVEIRLEPWSEPDLPLLEALMGDPATMAHLGGPESSEQIRQRHQRYLALPPSGTDHMFKIVLGMDTEGVGNIGYWQKSWRDDLVYEMGWFVLPAYQGRGIATRAGKALIALARGEGRHRFMHAFPAVDNAASNTLCRKLGFSMIEECEVEYPAGHPLRVNDWQLDLSGK